MAARGRGAPRRVKSEFDVECDARHGDWNNLCANIKVVLEDMRYPQKIVAKALGRSEHEK